VDLENDGNAEIPDPERKRRRRRGRRGRRGGEAGEAQSGEQSSTEEDGGAPLATHETPHFEPEAMSQPQSHDAPVSAAAPLRTGEAVESEQGAAPQAQAVAFEPQAEAPAAEPEAQAPAAQWETRHAEPEEQTPAEPLAETVPEAADTEPVPPAAAHGAHPIIVPPAEEALAAAGMQMVETRPDTPASAEPEAPAKPLGRPRKPRAVVESEPMQQVETH
jgi:ribonuclease E